jgi:para-aminobenzoate synthetase component I
MYSQKEAIELMNRWGADQVPFLFLIDFEMKSVKLFRLNQPIPEDIYFSLPSFKYYPDVIPDKTPFSFKANVIPYEKYLKSFQIVIDNINAGNSFLLNLTFPTNIETNLSLKEIFYRSQATYKLLYKDEFVVFSPEPFIEIKNNTIFSFPMKGTINAKIPNEESLILNNEKELAEHYTIVDLIRNDLSIVASEVEVPQFRYISRINTSKGDLLQVSSEIKGTLDHNYYKNIGSLLFSLLPAGSVTGAPKPKTLEIIRKAENQERGYYTGIFGCFNGQILESAVMIRFIEKKENQMFFRSGGGITSQSNPRDEYQELIEKIYVPFT